MPRYVFLLSIISNVRPNEVKSCTSERDAKSAVGTTTELEVEPVDPIQPQGFHLIHNLIWLKIKAFFELVGNDNVFDGSAGVGHCE
jgi:hypothetical protein